MLQSLQKRDERTLKNLTLRLPGRLGQIMSMGFQSSNGLQRASSFGFKSRSVQTEIGLTLREVQ